jgi:hypothetical protein
MNYPIGQQGGSEPWHGTVGGYCNHACRCDQCRAAKRAANAEGRRNARLMRRVRMPHKAHGTANGYSYWACRCDPCRAAEAKRYQARKRVTA